MKPHDPIECQDGFRMSVQASSFHYCYPRIDNAPFYMEYEVGYPSTAEALLMPYLEYGSETPLTSSVYAYVPTEVVASIIHKHGGLKKKE